MRDVKLEHLGGRGAQWRRRGSTCEQVLPGPISCGMAAECSGPIIIISRKLEFIPLGGSGKLAENLRALHALLTQDRLHNHWQFAGQAPATLKPTAGSVLKQESSNYDQSDVWLQVVKGPQRGCRPSADRRTYEDENPFQCLELGPDSAFGRCWRSACASRRG